MSNAHNPLTMRLYEYIHRTTKRKGESEAGVSHRHENQFICTDDMPGWFLNFHLRAFPSICSLLFSWQFWQISLKGVQAKLKAGWSQAKWVIHLCSIMTVFVFFFLYFLSTLPPLCQCDMDVLGLEGKIAGLISPLVFSLSKQSTEYF